MFSVGYQLFLVVECSFGRFVVGFGRSVGYFVGLAGFVDLGFGFVDYFESDFQRWLPRRLSRSWGIRLLRPGLAFTWWG